MTHSRRIVQMILRSDSARKGGGDTAQLMAYASSLETSGWHVDVRPYRRGLNFDDKDVVHLSNVDRTYEFLDAYRTAAAAGARIFVSPIHHSLADTRRMRRRMRTTHVRHVLNLVLPERVREAVVYFTRCLKGQADARAVLSLGLTVVSMKRRVKAALDGAEAIFLLAEAEGESLRREFSWHGQNGKLVPNGRPTPSRELTPWAARPRDSIVVAGRIEPRKRMLELVEAANILGIRLTFYGDAGEDRHYVEMFSNAVRTGPSTWHGAVSQSKLIEAMQESRVLVNASWVEVQSLVDLEAATNGCWVVTSPTGYSQSWLPNVILRCPTWRASELVMLARDLASGDRAPGKVEYEQTWMDAAMQIATEYERSQSRLRSE